MSALPVWTLPVWFVVSVAGFFVTFLPAIIGRNKLNCRAILALNFFLGWTGVGWVVALVWACTEDTRDQQERARPLNLVSLFLAHFILSGISALILWNTATMAMQAAEKEMRVNEQRERERIALVERKRKEEQARELAYERARRGEPEPTPPPAPAPTPVPLTSAQIAQQRAERRANLQRLVDEKKTQPPTREEEWKKYYQTHR